MRKKRMFFGALAISLLVIAGLCGFAAVDLSTERYMPGEFGVFLSISITPGEQISLTLLGQKYSLRKENVQAQLDMLKEYRGLLPAAPRTAHALTERAVQIIADKLAAQ